MVIEPNKYSVFEYFPLNGSRLCLAREVDGDKALAAYNKAVASPAALAGTITRVTIENAKGVQQQEWRCTKPLFK